jgi:hypothetical protein
VRSIKLIPLVQERARLNKRLVWTPNSGNTRSWPTCKTCLRDVDAVELKNMNSSSVELWARCHGAEDAVRVDYPYRLEDGLNADKEKTLNVARAMADVTFFDPKEA